MNGFDHLRRLGLVTETCQPMPADCITHPMAEIERALIELARQMTRAGLEPPVRPGLAAE